MKTEEELAFSLQCGFSQACVIFSHTNCQPTACTSLRAHLRVAEELTWFIGAAGTDRLHSWRIKVLHFCVVFEAAPADSKVSGRLAIHSLARSVWLLEHFDLLLHLALKYEFPHLPKPVWKAPGRSALSCNGSYHFWQWEGRGSRDHSWTAAPQFLHSSNSVKRLNTQPSICSMLPCVLKFHKLPN